MDFNEIKEKMNKTISVLDKFLYKESREENEN